MQFKVSYSVKKILQGYKTVAVKIGYVCSHTIMAELDWTYPKSLGYNQWISSFLYASVRLEEGNRSLIVENHNKISQFHSFYNYIIFDR